MPVWLPGGWPMPERAGHAQLSSQQVEHLTWEAGVFNPADIQKGMTARDRDGENLGLIVSVDEMGFLIEKGSYFPRDHRVAFSDVSDIDRDDVYLREDLASLPGVRPDVLEARGEAARHAVLHHDATGALGVIPGDLDR
ncbi:hypothetical protein HUA74_09650 [Myxococcus sp. CA051A]|uniref:hypothetical protein n=2 Tax=unclassified Myxococcus TaxID=2648731 RepID=UPI00157A74A4|nr:hypothetical protein [Myxococcus sp. CA051A]NTX60922.1 hypothetical protein [Myxococcus sp. CA051A]